MIRNELVAEIKMSLLQKYIIIVWVEMFTSSTILPIIECNRIKTEAFLYICKMESCIGRIDLSGN